MRYGGIVQKGEEWWEMVENGFGIVGTGAEKVRIGGQGW